jgi:hypothetical protein
MSLYTQFKTNAEKEVEGVTTYQYEYNLINQHTTSKKPAFITETGWSGDEVSDEKVTRWGQFTNGKKYDVIISAAGSPMLIVGKEIKEDTILIDYGCSPYATVNGVQKFCGDFDVSCYEKCKHYTPVPGCMGPLVVASLFENVLKSIKTEN